MEICTRSNLTALTEQIISEKQISPSSKEAFLDLVEEVFARISLFSKWTNKGNIQTNCSFDFDLFNFRKATH